MSDAFDADLIVYCNGFGMANREVSIGAGCNTVYDIGSITKQFTTPVDHAGRRSRARRKDRCRWRLARCEL